MATILITDDDPIVREIASDMLRNTGHAALLAEDGLEVLALLNHLPIDLLVTDMMMPNMDGIEVILEVRAKHPGVKILALSGGGSVGVDYLMHTAKMLGAHAVLAKPLRLDLFVATIDDLLLDDLRGRIEAPQRSRALAPLGA